MVKPPVSADPVIPLHPLPPSHAPSLYCLLYHLILQRQRNETSLELGWWQVYTLLQHTPEKPSKTFGVRSFSTGIINHIFRRKEQPKNTPHSHKLSPPTPLTHPPLD